MFQELILLKSGDEWSRVQKFSGEQGHVPTTYVKDFKTTVIKIRPETTKQGKRNTIGKMSGDLDGELLIKFVSVYLCQFLNDCK